ncbi:alcohol dehydrogenase catalytic domain-containing protein [Streptomyces massasporeus]|uniref:alcohol dehydrogenase catalytic domain-containing protein n=1 Tax=Streptomyces massasporeus TaxID=67324 RepID=UPI0033DA1534
MRAGDVIGHEFVGEVVETDPGVRKHKVGDRVVVCSFVGCGRCWYCANDLWSLRGSHAEYVRVPFAGYGASRSPRASTTPVPCSSPTSCAPGGWAPTWPG